MVFNDASLNDIVLKVPKTLSELENIKGLGKSKIEMYGTALLAKIQEYYRIEEAK